MNAIAYAKLSWETALNEHENGLPRSMATVYGPVGGQRTGAEVAWLYSRYLKAQRSFKKWST